jgi:hypothetical protein
MLSRCAKCGTSWTSLGTTLCPICGENVQGSNGTESASRPATRKLKIEGDADDVALRAPSSAVMELPPGILRPESRPKTTLLRPAPEPVPPQPVVIDPDPVDASVLVGPEDGDELGAELPAPARPLNGPLILGLFALATVILLPLTVAYESHRVFGVLGFCMLGFLLPFSPIAWVAGLNAENRRRSQLLRPELRVVVGRLLGAGCTLILVAELSIGLVMIAAMRLAGRLPSTFWAP